MLHNLFKNMYINVIIAVILAVIFGYFFPNQAVMVKPLGEAFILLIKMMIAPVVFCTIAIGIGKLTERKQVKYIIGKTLGLFLLMTILALCFGLFTVQMIKPGAGMNIDTASLDISLVGKYINTAEKLNFVQFFMNIIPDTFVGAFSKGKVLPVLLLAVLTGFAISSAGDKGQKILSGLENISHILFKIFNFLMKLSPVGAFGAMSFTIGKYGIGSLTSLASLMATFYITCIGFVAIVLGGLCYINGFSLWRTLKYFREELAIVLGTSSTEPVLPSVLQKLENLGCKKSVVGLVLPMGYSFNLEGTAIYLSLGSLFIAQACNIEQLLLCLQL